MARYDDDDVDALNDLRDLFMDDELSRLRTENEELIQEVLKLKGELKSARRWISNRLNGSQPQASTARRPAARQASGRAMRTKSGHVDYNARRIAAEAEWETLVALTMKRHGIDRTAAVKRITAERGRK